MQDFKLGGGALKKIAPSGGRRENFGGISCEKSPFYAKKSYFFQLPREARKFLRYFVWKITILRQKIMFFPILGGGGRAPGAPPPESAPACVHQVKSNRKLNYILPLFLAWKMSSDKNNFSRSRIMNKISFHYITDSPFFIVLSLSAGRYADYTNFQIIVRSIMIWILMILNKRYINKQL